MAEETIERAIKEGMLIKRKCVTSNLKLNGPDSGGSSNRLKIYGDHSAEIENIIKENPLLGEPIDTQLPYTRAEIVWIARNEMAVTVEDVLARRTRALFLDAGASLKIACEVAEIMAREMGHERGWVAEQVEEYKKIVVNYQ
jgi:glycerol-3-phosphate dehydrogenase